MALKNIVDEIETRSIFQYPILNERVVIEMPESAEILTIQKHYNTPVMCVLADPNNPLIKRSFMVVGVDLLIAEKNVTYIGTFQFGEGGSLIYHVFEKN